MDYLSSGLGGSCRPCYELGVSTTRGNLGDWKTLQKNSSPVTYTTFSIQIAGNVLKRAIACNRFWQICSPFPWSSFKLHQYWILVRFPNVFVHCDSGFVPIVLDFFQIFSFVHRVYGCKEHWLPTLSEASSSQDESTFDNGVDFICVPDVVDVLGKVIRQQYIVLQCRINESTSWVSWIALKYNKSLEELGFKQYWNLSFGPPPFARKVIQASIDHCEVPSNFALNFSIRSSNLTAPSSSLGMVSSVVTVWSWILTLQNNLWLYFPGSASIRFRSR